MTGSTESHGSAARPGAATGRAAPAPGGENGTAGPPGTRSDENGTPGPQPGALGDPAAFRAPGRYRDALASGEYRTVAGAFVISMLGSVVAGLALTVLIYRQTASSLLSALTFALALLPYAIGGTLMSGLVDRVRPRRLLAGCDLGSAALVAAMTIPGLPVGALLTLQFTLGLLAPLSAGGRAALLPDVLPPAAVVPGRSLLRVIAQGAQIAGYAAGGGLLAGLPPRAVLVVEAGAFAASALLQRAFLRPRPARAATSRSGTRHDGTRHDDAGHDDARHDGARHDGAGHDDARHDGAAHGGTPHSGARDVGTRRRGARHDGVRHGILRNGGSRDGRARRRARSAGPDGGRRLVRESLSGVRAVLRIPPLRRALLLGWLVPFLVVAPEGLAAPAVAARGLPPSATGWWMLALPAGTVAGELAGLRLIPAARRARLAAPLSACGFLPLLCFAARPPLPVALCLLAACGLCGAYLLGVDQLVLETSPPELLGRVYTVQSAALMTVQGLGFAGAGALAEALPPDVVVATAGAAGLACVALLGLRPRSGDRVPPR